LKRLRLLVGLESLHQINPTIDKITCHTTGYLAWKVSFINTNSDNQNNYDRHWINARGILWIDT